MHVVNTVDWTLESFQICDDVVNLRELVLVFNCIYRAGKILDIIQVLLDFIVFMLPVNGIHRVCHVFEFNDSPGNVFKCMLSGLNIKDRANKVFKGVHFFINFIELMFIINTFSDREVHLLKSINTL